MLKMEMDIFVYRSDVSHARWALLNKTCFYYEQLRLSSIKIKTRF